MTGRRLFLSLFALLLFAAPAQADVTIKLATLAPEGTSWYKAIRGVADRWEELSDGEVKVKIYAGGVAGHEGAMVRKMRIGQLHGGAITNLGLMDIDQAPQVLQTPLLVKNYGELDYVMGKIGPTFEQRIKDKGFVILTWGDAGWVHLFSKKPLLQPEDAGKFKTFAYEGDPEAVKLFKDAGFNPVVMSSTDVLPGLQSGLIDAFPMTPLASLSLQWFALAKNMLDIPWAPLTGATVLTEDAWNSIPEKYHEEFMKIAREEGKKVKDEIRKQDKKAISVMEKYGLTVNEVDAATVAKWEVIGENTHERVRGKMVPAEIFDEVKRLLKEYRSK